MLDTDKTGGYDKHGRINLNLMWNISCIRYIEKMESLQMDAPFSCDLVIDSCV